MAFLLRKFLKKTNKQKTAQNQIFIKKTYILNYHISTMNNTSFVLQ